MTNPEGTMTDRPLSEATFDKVQTKVVKEQITTDAV